MLLVIDNEDGTHEEAHLPERDIVIGRSPEADIVLEGPKISREHCRIGKSEGKFYVQDLESKNGTLVNGARITVSEIKQGDLVSLGGFTLTLRSEGKGPETMIREIGEEMEGGKGYSTMLKEIVNEADHPPGKQES